MRTLEFEIPREYDGFRVDTALRTYWGMSGTVIKEQKKIPDGLLLNGEHIRSVDTVRAGDILTVNMRDRASENIVPEDIPLRVLYEDEDILIVNKAPGMPTHPSPGHYGATLANAVMHHYAANGEAHVFRAVNRLDSGTSGVMCVAKNSHSHSVLSAQGHGAIERRYLALVEGTLSGSGTIDAPIARGEGIRRIVFADGQRAVTMYRALSERIGATLVELRLETGRTHQIRVHMAHIGHPLLGDWLYGTEDKRLISRPALHSSYLRLTHPITRRTMEFEAPLPADMARCRAVSIVAQDAAHL